MTAPTTEAPAEQTEPAYVERWGAHRAADLLAELSGSQVWSGDIDDLVHAEVLAYTGSWKGNPLVDVEAVRALAAREDFAELLAEHRLLTTAAAAVYLEIRPSDFGYVVAAGWLPPHQLKYRKVGRRKWIEYPVYHRTQLDAVKDLPGVDWEAVRATPAGRPSPLRELVRKPPTRAAQVRWFCTQMSHRWKVEFWATWDNATDTWWVNWDTTRGGKPTREQVAAALAKDKVVSQHQVKLGSDDGLAVRWARQMLRPRAGCVLDTETTDLHGRVCEVAVIDTATGKVLLDTLVNPGVPIEPGAQAIHGISDEMVADAPTFDQVLPRLLKAVGRRTVLAYNSEYDQNVIVTHARELGLDPGRLADGKTWGCIMVNYTAWLRAWRWPRLGGGHRALGDCRVALERLMEMTTPYKRG